MTSYELPHGHVALDGRKISRARQRHDAKRYVAADSIARCAATMATARGRPVDVRNEVARYRQAAAERRPYVLPEWRAHLYALALGVELPELLAEAVS